jgi:two-component system, sensor histidine kinase RegB
MVLAVIVFASLFMLPVGACCPNHPTHGAFSAHLYGMLFAFVLGAGLVTYFLANVRRSLNRRADEMAELRTQAEQGARFAALGTLAAGTAHELNTPLATIYVLASELAEQRPSPDDTAQAAHRIRQQVERCRAVLTRLQGASSEPLDVSSGDIGEAVDDAVTVWRQAHPGVEVEVERLGGGAGGVSLTPEEVTAALGVLLDNALFATEAAGAPKSIRITIEGLGDGARIHVRDGGSGIDPSLLGRLGEPFVTTKEPGEGMGLGLFWVRSMLKRVGGSLSVESERSGTTVTLDLGASTAIGPS